MRKMKLSRNFVSDYVDIDVDSKTLAEGMTSIGNEYDSCGPLLPVSNLIIGEVVDCVDHPDSDHLLVCQVNIGKEVLQIVCGAPNIKAGATITAAYFRRDAKVDGDGINLKLYKSMEFQKQCFFCHSEEQKQE